MGQVSIPAKRYPMIKGCLILKNASVTIDPIIMIKAKSVTKPSMRKFRSYLFNQSVNGTVKRILNYSRINL